MMPIKLNIRFLLYNPRLLFGSLALIIFIICGLAAPWLAPYDPTATDITKRLLAPSLEHLLGCDLDGADVLSTLLYGARVSLYIGFLTVFISITLGTVVGLCSGYWRGWVDAIFMRVVDLLMAFPGILLALALTAIMGPSLLNIVFAISATGWMASARLVRGQVLTLREREYVTASQALGTPSWRIIFQHLLPGVLSPLAIQATFSLSGVIITEASLSFLGLGAQNEASSWGAMLNQGRTVLAEAPHLSLAPGIAIMVLVLALNFVGDAMRDILDPRS